MNSGRLTSRTAWTREFFTARSKQRLVEILARPALLQGFARDGGGVDFQFFFFHAAHYP
jgi:hypothetical protein